mgnify:CR=1 FL=1
MARVVVHRIECRTPQERSVVSDGNEVWVRLAGTTEVHYSPPDARSTWHMVAGRILTVNLQVDFQTTAELELWDMDVDGSDRKPVEERDSQLLATWSFIVTDEPGEDMVATLNQLAG